MNFKIKHAFYKYLFTQFRFIKKKKKKNPKKQPALLMNSRTKKIGNKTLIQFSSVAQLYPTLCDPMI